MTPRATSRTPRPLARFLRRVRALLEGGSSSSGRVLWDPFGLEELEGRVTPSVYLNGPEFRVHTSTATDQRTFTNVQVSGSGVTQQIFTRDPQAVAMDPQTGDFVVVWSGQGNNSDNVYFQRYNSQGIALGGATRVNSNGSGNCELASVAMNASGNFVVTWSRENNGSWSVFAQVFNASGQALDSSDMAVSQPAGSNSQLYSSVGMDSSGNFVITWSGDQSGNWDVYARQFGSNGSPTGNPFVVNTTRPADQLASQIAMDPNGDYVIVWQSQNQVSATSGWDIYAQRYNETAGAQGGEFLVNGTTANDQGNASVGMDQNGNFVVSWSSQNQVSPTSGSDIYAKEYNLAGAVVLSDFRVNTTTAGDQEYSSVGMQPNGNFGVTWQSQNQVSSSSGWDVYGQEYNKFGTAQGSEFLINSTTAGDQEAASFAMGSSGQAVAVWTYDNPNNQGSNEFNVYARRILSSDIIVTPTSGLTTTESGGTATFTVRLASAPSLLSTVVVPISSSDTSQGAVSTPNIVFNFLNWSIPYTVTVTGVNNGTNHGPVGYRILIGPISSGDQNFQGELGPDVYVTNDGNGAAGIAVGSTSPASATEGQSLSQVLTSFTDGATGQSAGTITATIDWGDNQTSTGTVASTGSNSYTVSGSHTYTGVGSYPITIRLQDTAGDTATASTTARVADAPLSATGQNFYFLKSSATTATVASFTDGNPNAAAGDFSALIDWGDGTTSAGTVSANRSGGFDVTGAHTYSVTTDQTVGVTITDVSGSQANTSSTAVYTVLSGSASTINPTEQSAFSGVVASFHNSQDLTDPASAYSATITWGNGDNSTGTVSSAGNGNYTVSGTETYAEAGSYPVGVTIQWSQHGGAALVVSGTATVADAPLTSSGASQTLIARQEVDSGPAVVASFTDGNTSAPVGDFTATINWGDGTTSTGTVSSNGGGSFNVSGGHTYQSTGTFGLTVSVQDVDGSSVVATNTRIAVSTNDAPLDAVGPATTINATEGTDTGAELVAKFFDEAPSSPPGNFTALIHWGDGSTSTGTVARVSGQTFSVTGNHTYGNEGSYLVSVDVRDIGGSTVTVRNTTCVIDDAPLTTAGTPVSGTEGATLTNVQVATLTDGNSLSDGSDLSVTIAWGDGTTSAGSLQAVGGGVFRVLGSHAYAEESSYTVSVSVSDAGGSNTSCTSAATVADTPLTAAGVPVAATEGVGFNNVPVATLSDGNPGSTGSELSVVIAWGDGATSAGVLTANGQGGFTVSGSHTYGQAGEHTFTVTVTDQGGASVTVQGAAMVAAAPSTPPAPGPSGEPTSGTNQAPPSTTEPVASPVPTGGVVLTPGVIGLVSGISTELSGVPQQTPHTVSLGGGSAGSAEGDASADRPAVHLVRPPAVAPGPASAPVAAPTGPAAAVAQGAGGHAAAPPPPVVTAPARAPMALLSKMLDQFQHDVEEQKPHHSWTVDAVFTAGVASVGYVMLTSRAAAWVLAAVTSRPLWKQFDPIEILFAWEADGKGKPEPEDDGETLQTLVSDS